IHPRLTQVGAIPESKLQETWLEVFGNFLFCALIERRPRRLRWHREMNDALAKSIARDLRPTKDCFWPIEVDNIASASGQVKTAVIGCAEKSQDVWFQSPID